MLAISPDLNAAQQSHPGRLAFYVERFNRADSTPSKANTPANTPNDRALEYELDFQNQAREPALIFTSHGR